MPSVFENAISLSIVVPTFNEKENVAEIVRRLEGSLSDVAWEVVFVDDASPDGTADRVRELARSDRRVRLISRHNRRGLSSAVVEGALAASASIIAVMDGDLQDPPEVIPALAEQWEEGYDVVYALKRERKEALPKRALFNLFYWLLRRLSNVDIPADAGAWTVKVRGAATLAANLAERRDDAVLYRDLAVLRTDAPIPESLDELRWRGADRELLAALCDEIADDSFAARVTRWRDQ